MRARRLSLPEMRERRQFRGKVMNNLETFPKEISDLKTEIARLEAEVELWKSCAKAEAAVRAALERKQGLIGYILSVPDVDWNVIKPEQTQQEETNEPIISESIPATTTTPPVPAPGPKVLARRPEDSDEKGDRSAAAGDVEVQGAPSGQEGDLPGDI